MDFGNEILNHGTPFNGFGALGGPGFFGMTIGGGGGGVGADPNIPYDRGANNKVDATRISQVFQQTFGRPATQNEIDEFSPYIKNGDLSYDEVGKIVQGLPQAQEQRLNQYAGQYNNALAGSDNAILGRAAQQGVGLAAGSGRTDSSAVDATIASAGRDLAIGRQSQLAQFYGGGLQGIMGQYGAQSNNLQNRGYGLQDQRNIYNRDLRASVYGYNQQKNDYQNMFNQQQNANRQSQLIGGLFQLGGTAAGAYFGGPMGAQAGSMVGQSMVPQGGYRQGSASAATGYNGAQWYDNGNRGGLGK